MTRHTFCAGYLLCAKCLVMVLVDAETDFKKSQSLIAAVWGDVQTNALMGSWAVGCKRACGY